MPQETFSESREVFIIEGKEVSEPITPLSPEERASFLKRREKYVKAGLLPPLPPIWSDSAPNQPTNESGPNESGAR